jgi:pyruvate kinase
MAGTEQMVSTTYQNLPSDVKAGDLILLDDGLIRLEVKSRTRDTVNCKVINGSILKENKGINLPGVTVSAPSLTEKDIRDVNFGIKNGVDYFALSFVRTADDLVTIKSLMKKQGVAIPVIAKIEKPEAVENLEAILDAADGIMVARGDLGVEMRPELVPIIQKDIIFATVRKNKPVITATQMLETMSVNPIPTRAEASDVANAIFDGTDAIMLSGETAYGKYPREAVQTMANISRAVEQQKESVVDPALLSSIDPAILTESNLAKSAALCAEEMPVQAIITSTRSGQTARLCAAYRGKTPIFALSESLRTVRELSLSYGIHASQIDIPKTTDELVKICLHKLLQEEKIDRKNLIVFLGGGHIYSHHTNFMQIETPTTLLNES